MSVTDDVLPEVENDTSVPQEDLDYEEGRFSFVNSSDWQRLSSVVVCPNTRRKLLYVNSLFEEWKMSRNSQRPNDAQVPDKTVIDYTVEELNK